MGKTENQHYLNINITRKNDLESQLDKLNENKSKGA